jgi:pimeloyl-ACP methyl ester carboxylesterase
MKRKIISELKKRLVSTISSIPFPKIKSPTLQIWGEEDLFLAKELTEGTDEFVDASLSLKIIEEFLDYNLNKN